MVIVGEALASVPGGSTNIQLISQEKPADD
jgi:hypothetical protein